MNVGKSIPTQDLIIAAGTRAFQALPEGVAKVDENPGPIKVAGVLVLMNPAEYEDNPDAAAYQALELEKFFDIRSRG